MPPKKKAPKGPGRPPINPSSATAPSSNVVCPICEDLIDDDSHESIHCSGRCQSWIHRGCGGLTLRAFKIAKESGPFHCPSCRVNYLSNEISRLQQDLSNLSHSLSSRITSLESRLSSIEEPVISRSEGGREINHGLEDTTIPTTGNGDAIPPSTSKFSIVISGIPECSPGTRRNARISHDFEKVADVIHSVDNFITLASIRDCRRMGKYSPTHPRPRPALVTLNSSKDVVSLLAKRGSVSQPYVIKPNMSKSERLIERLLLNERWRLIQSHVSKRDIRIGKSVIYVNGVPHAKVINSSLVLSEPASTELTPNDPISNPASNVSIEQPLPAPSQEAVSSPEGGASSSS